MLYSNSSAATSALRKPAVSLADSTDLRIIISVLYTICEVLRVQLDSDTDEMKRIREVFHTEVGQAVPGQDLMAVTLLGMITRFCSGNVPHFPIKKILLLLWKVLLVSGCSVSCSPSKLWLHWLHSHVTIWSCYVMRAGKAKTKALKLKSFLH